MITPAADRPLDGRTAVVTGASSGIGAAAARQLAALGARLVILGRDPARTAAVAAETGATAVLADFTRFADVRRAADEVLAACPTIEILLDNAGGLFPGPAATEDGHELTVQVNHLAPFLLTNLLLPALRAAAGSRVVVTSSMTNVFGRVDLTRLGRYRWPGRSAYAYADAKLLNILFARELARREAPDGPLAVSVHPGAIVSNFGRDARWVRVLYSRPLRALGGSSADDGARTLVAAATRPDLSTINGAYLYRYTPRDRGFTPRQARDVTLARDLWELSAALVGLDVTPKE
jgi:NAD(P)-dependent dehydrogenase (short-subunit alcohol dehydrogenase family)